jgi:peptide-methionine (R)-S-oxide reductase
MPHSCQQRVIFTGTILIAGIMAAALPSDIVADPDSQPADRSKAAADSDAEVEGSEENDRKVVKTDAQWRKILTREQFRVARRGQTEDAYRNAYWKSKKDGLYRCVCCGQLLFDSKAKFDSGTGWPSFFEPVKKDALAYHEDRSTGEVRTEVQCRRCDAHLGHVFGDGPQPTGLRFCMNSASLKWVNRKSAREESQDKGTRSRQRP